jgi:hypothetical protein
MTKNDIIKKVQQALAKHARKGWNISVVEKGVHREDDWWYVPVAPAGTSRRTIVYYDLLAKVETDLQDSLKLHVLLIPTAA